MRSGWIFPLTVQVFMSSEMSPLGFGCPRSPLTPLRLTKNVNVLNLLCEGREVTQCVFNTPTLWCDSSLTHTNKQTNQRLIYIKLIQGKKRFKAPWFVNILQIASRNSNLSNLVWIHIEQWSVKEQQTVVKCWLSLFFFFWKICSYFGPSLRPDLSFCGGHF